jgi:hypothetical protein
MARLNEPKELLLKDIRIPMSSYAKSEREYNSEGVDPKTSSRKELIRYILSQIEIYQNQIKAEEDMYWIFVQDFNG